VTSKIIKGGRILTITHGILEKGDILIENGKIVAVSEELATPEAAEIINAAGKFVMPGMIDCHTHIGLDETYIWDDINELNEIGDPITPFLCSVDGFNPKDSSIRAALASGITSVISHTGSIQMLSGQSASFKLIPDGNIDLMVRKNPVCIKGGFGGTPKRFYHSLKKFPSTRMGEATVLRQAFIDATAYKNGWKPTIQGQWNEVEKLEALLQLINGEIPWSVHVYKLYDICTCLRIAQEFDIKLVLEHGGEAAMIADELASKDIAVTIGPSGFIGAVKPETLFPVLDHLQEFINADVVFGFQSDHPIIHSASLPQAVGMLVRRGFNEDNALEALTLNGAKILGEEHILGSLESGKNADIVIASGSIFDYQTHVELVMIDGKIVFSNL
jgi:imidazolonepropionase-like amidohydrolase